MNFKNNVISIVIIIATFALADLVPAELKLIVAFAGGVIVGPVKLVKKKGDK